MTTLVYDLVVGDVVTLEYARQRVVFAWTRGLTAEQWERVALHLRRCERRRGGQERCPGGVTRGCDRVDRTGDPWYNDDA